MRKPVIKCLYFSLSDSVEQFKVGCSTDMSKYARCQVINHFTAGGEKTHQKHHRQTLLVGRGHGSRSGLLMVESDPVQTTSRPRRAD